MTASSHAVALVTTAALAAAEKKAEDVLAFDVSDQLAITDAFVLCSAPNERQVGAIVDEVEEQLRLVHDARPLRREGHRDGHWVLLDYGDVVVHVLHSEQRVYYSLERIWKDCPSIPLPAQVRA